MQFGISVDAPIACEAIAIIRKYRIVQHVQFYLSSNRALDWEQIETFIRVIDRPLTYSFHEYGYLNLCDPFSEVRYAWSLINFDTINKLASINGKFINLHAGYLLSNDCSFTDSVCYLRESLQKICQYATHYGIEIHVENDYSSGSIRCIGTTIHEMREILKSRPSNLFMCYDIGHANLTFESPYDYRMLADVIKSMHIHNNNTESDQHFPLGREGGVIDLITVYRENANNENLYFILENNLADYELGLKCASTLIC